MVCALCLQNRGLRNSHIIPQFVADWIKKSSATGYIRQGIHPNLRKQDITTIKLLCGECETRLSQWENKFKNSIFLPYLDNGVRNFEYDEWLLKFVVSLLWRVGIVESTAKRLVRDFLRIKVGRNH